MVNIMEVEIRACNARLMALPNKSQDTMRTGKNVDGTRSVEKLKRRGNGKQGGNTSKKCVLEK